jgi:hypothetical protein
LQVPCASSDGQTIDLFGPEAIPASLSASPESKLDSRIDAIPKVKPPSTRALQRLKASETH